MPTELQFFPWRSSKWLSLGLLALTVFCVEGILSASLVDSTDTCSIPNTGLHDKHLEQAQSVFRWVAKGENAYISPKQVVRRATPGDINSPLGVYATERIYADEIITRVPWDYIISSDDPDEEPGDQLSCSLLNTLAWELKQGNESMYAPYIEYLNDEPDGQIPTSWSDEAFELFLEVLGNQSIPPYDTLNWLEVARNSCNVDTDDIFVRRAVLLIIQRSDDAIMIPAYDAYNHRNGKWKNTRTKIVQKKYHETRASKVIEAGEQILLSYNFCDECGGRAYHYGTAEIFRDYGFVEYFPQRWWYMEEEYHFNLDKDSEEKPSLTWDEVSNPLDLDKNEKEQVMIWFRRQLVRLRRLKNIDWNPMVNPNLPHIPSYQWNNIWGFVDANILAMEMALESLQLTPAALNPCTRHGRATCDSDAAAESHYHELAEETADLENENLTCDFNKFLEAWKWRFRSLEEVESSHQKIVFKRDDANDNVCLAVDGVVEICSSFRPYLEYRIHSAAQYIEEVKRVVIVGGGNSMVLHEALKYPNLDLIVVFEFDQELPRKSFKHFGTDPNFDDPRVEWWFCDPANSLVMLPNDYWGSFDLVLNDVVGQEDENVHGALFHLLSPTGVFVTNSMKSLTSAFTYMAKLYFRNPEICDEAVVFASNSLDFFHAPLYEHAITALMYQHGELSRFQHFHDYKFNKIGRKSDVKQPSPRYELQQDHATGLFHVVNFENDAIFDHNEDALCFLSSKVESVGFSILELDVFEDNHGMAIFTEEGYVVVRKTPTGRYFGFEVLLWSQIERMRQIKSALLEGLGVSASSSYNVIVGGIIGNLGDGGIFEPGVEADLLEGDSVTVTALSTLDPRRACVVAISETVQLTTSDKITAVVVCGSGDLPCFSLESLKNQTKIGSLIELYECDGINKDLVKTYECENQMFLKVRNHIEKTRSRVAMIVVDGNASIRLHRIWDSILARKDVIDDWMEDKFLLVTWAPDSESQYWRGVFLDRFRQTIQDDPVSKAEISLEDNDQSFTLGVVSIGNPSVIYDYRDLEKRLQSKLMDSLSTTQIRLKSIRGGVFPFDEDPHTEEFRQSDYDSNSEPYEEDYMFAGQQTIFQVVQKDATQRTLFSLNMDTFFQLLLEALGKLGFDLSGVNPMHVGVKKGGITAISLNGGNIIARWDGDRHVTLNCFSDEVDVFDDLLEVFHHVAKGHLETMEYSHQPRGRHAIIYPSDFMDEEDSEEVEDDN